MNFSSLRHVFPDSARITDAGHLELGGIDVVSLVNEYDTPLYVFCEETLRNRSKEFLDAFSSLYPNSRVAYAAKAYLGPALARLVQDMGLGMDVVSGGELAVAKFVEFKADRIFFHGNNKSSDELGQALQYGVGYIVVDNMHELEVLQSLATKMNRQQKILLRVNPGVDPHTHSHTTTGILDSKFGFPLSTGQAEVAIKEAMTAKNIELCGIHFHLGSPIFDLEPYAEAINIVLQFISKIKGAEDWFQVFSPGGGFAISYTGSQIPPRPIDYASTIVSSLVDGCAEFGLRQPELVIEPGRSITGPAGVAIYSVGAIKEIPEVRIYSSVDGGMGDNIRPALYGASYEVIAATRLFETPTTRMTISGKFCESGDILVKDAFLPSLKSGDLIAIPASGAYSPSMASNYNMNPRPPIVLVNNGKSSVMRRRETLEDMLICDL